VVEGLDPGGDLLDELGRQRIDSVDLPPRSDRVERVANWQRRP
jgi:hypothetical protein